MIDTHNRPVCPKVWDLYRTAVGLLGTKPTLIEWDTDIPAFSVLMDEAEQAKFILEDSRVTAA